MASVVPLSEIYLNLSTPLTVETHICGDGAINLSIDKSNRWKYMGQF